MEKLKNISITTMVHTDITILTSLWTKENNY